MMRASFSRRTRISSDSGTSDSSSFAKVREFYLVLSARCLVVLFYSVPSTDHYAPGGGVGGGVCCAGFVTGGAGGTICCAGGLGGGAGGGVGGMCPGGAGGNCVRCRFGSVWY